MIDFLLVASTVTNLGGPADIWAAIIKDFSNISYAIPNYLTSGRVNLRFRVDF